MLYKSKRRRVILKRTYKYRINLKNLHKPKSSSRSHKPYKLYIPSFFQKCFKTDFHIKNLKDILPKELDVVVSDSTFIYGYQVQQETMTSDQFFNYNGDLNLYLAQQPLYKRIHKKDIEPEVQQEEIDKLNEQQIRECKITNPFGNLEDISSMNLWISKGYTDSGWHYDSYDNFLGVHKGTKIVWLANKVNWQDWVGVYEEQYNHLKNTDSKIKARYVVLKPNELLFIPQGTFHRVISLYNSVALNIWLQGIEQNKLKTNDYQFRYILHEKIQKYSIQRLKDQAKETLQQVKNLNFFERIVRENSYEQMKFKKHRTVYGYGFDQQIIILLSLILLRFDSKYFINFLKQFMCFLPYLTDFSYLIIAFKLDDYTQKDIYYPSFKEFKQKREEKIEERESILMGLQEYSEILDKIREIQSKWVKQCGAELLLSHL